jgi:hypothetical protein
LQIITPGAAKYAKVANGYVFILLICAMHPALFVLHLSETGILLIVPLAMILLSF